jgi:alternate signal-mediated exported protein
MKGLVAGAAGIALLLGGSTFAMWSVGQDVAAPASITHGDMAIEDNATYTTTGYYDTRVAGSDNAVKNASVTAIDPQSFLAVPGDVIEIDLPAVDVTVSGDNMKYDIEVKGQEAASLYGWTIEGYAYQLNGASWVQVGGTSGTVDLTGTTSAKVGLGLTDDATVRVVLIATLDSTLTGTTHANAVQAFKGLTVVAQQVTI